MKRDLVEIFNRTSRRPVDQLMARELVNNHALFDMNDELMLDNGLVGEGLDREFTITLMDEIVEALDLSPQAFEFIVSLDSVRW